MNQVNRNQKRRFPNLKPLLFLSCLMAVGLAIDTYVFSLKLYALFPRQADQLIGIIFSPFIHVDIHHLTSNLVGFGIFGALCLLRSDKFFWLNSLFIIVISGLLVWCFGRDAFHIGASGWVYGLWSLQMAFAWFERRFVNIVIALFVAFFYSGLTIGMFPVKEGVSFEFHLFGALSGVLSAFFYSRLFPQSASRPARSRVKN